MARHDIVMKRQGDLLFERQEDYKLLRQYEVKDGVIARGEATGHVHQLKGAALYNQFGQMIVDAPDGGVVTHDEHDRIELEPGIWLVHTQREYSAAGEMVQAYD